MERILFRTLSNFRNKYIFKLYVKYAYLYENRMEMNAFDFITFCKNQIVIKIQSESNVWNLLNNLW